MKVASIDEDGTGSGVVPMQFINISRLPELLKGLLAEAGVSSVEALGVACRGAVALGSAIDLIAQLQREKAITVGRVDERASKISMRLIAHGIKRNGIFEVDQGAFVLSGTADDASATGFNVAEEKGMVSGAQLIFSFVVNMVRVSGRTNTFLEE